MKYFSTLFSFVVVTLFAACTADALPEPEPSDCIGDTPTYDIDIRPIVESTCAYSGCHLGAAPGVYNSYGNLLADLESGLFRERVINLKDDEVNGMPPNTAPDDRPENLTEEQLQLIDCWLQGGFPQ